MADKSTPQSNRDDRTTGMADEEIRGVAGADDDDFEDNEDLDEEEDDEESSTL